MKGKGRRTVLRAFTLALILVLLSTSGALALTIYKTLEFGSSGDDVLKLQQSLLTLGFDPDGVDGRFGTRHGKCRESISKKHRAGG